MSENKIDSKKVDALNSYASDFEAPKKPLRSRNSINAISNPERFSNEIASVKGLSVSEATEIHFGKNYKAGNKDQTFYVRNKILRPLWQSGKSNCKSLAIANKGDQRYYHVPDTFVPKWRDAMESEQHTIKEYNS